MAYATSATGNVRLNVTKEQTVLMSLPSKSAKYALMVKK
jgi:hypothetical protein